MIFTFSQPLDLDFFPCKQLPYQDGKQHTGEKSSAHLFAFRCRAECNLNVNFHMLSFCYFGHCFLPLRDVTPCIYVFRLRELCAVCGVYAWRLYASVYFCSFSLFFQSCSMMLMHSAFPSHSSISLLDHAVTSPQRPQVFVVNSVCPLSAPFFGFLGIFISLTFASPFLSCKKLVA